MTENEIQSQVKREVTSLKVNPELWKRVKIQAVTEGITLGELLDEALDMRLNAPRNATQQTRKIEPAKREAIVEHFKNKKGEKKDDQ